MCYVWWCIAGCVHSTSYLNHKQLVHYTFQRCKDSAIPCTTSGPSNCNALETELYMQAFPALEDLRPN